MHKSPNTSLSAHAPLTTTSPQSIAKSRSPHAVLPLVMRWSISLSRSPLPQFCLQGDDSEAADVELNIPTPQTHLSDRHMIVEIGIKAVDQGECSLRAEVSSVPLLCFTTLGRTSPLSVVCFASRNLRESQRFGVNPSEQTAHQVKSVVY